MGHQPERTCIGCREAFPKDRVVRIVAGPAGALIDYREKLPGRAAYVCPRRACIERALTKGRLAQALKRAVTPPAVADFEEQLARAITEKIRSLIGMALRAGHVAVGFSAAADAIGKNRACLLLTAEDIAEGTREKLETTGAPLPDRQAALFTRGELGALTGRELAGVAVFVDPGFADAVWEQFKRLKGLRNHDE